MSIDWVTGCKQARCALKRCEKAIAKRVLSGQGVPIQSKLFPTYLYVHRRYYYDGDESGAITVMMIVIRRAAYLPRWSTCGDDDDRLASQQ